MAATSPAPLRQAPTQFVNILRWYLALKTVFYWTHYLLGLGSTVLATTVAYRKAHSPASNAEASNIDVDFWLTVSAAGLAFLVTTLNANKVASGYEAAADIMQTAIANYETDPTLALTSLAAAQAAAIKAMRERR